MQLSAFWKCVGIFLAVGVCACSAQDGFPKANNNASKRVPTKALDISIPLNEIGAKLNKVLAKPVNISAVLDPLLGCLGMGTGERQALFSLPVEQHDLEIRIQKYFMDLNALIPKENITEYCNGPKFEVIHNFLWNTQNRTQFQDMVKFFQKYGYPNIYPIIKAIYTEYECPQKLIDMIPDGPPAEVKRTFQSQYRGANIRNQVLSSPAKEFNSSLLQLPAECNILKVLTGFLGSGLVELLSLVETVLNQIMTESSMQFLIGKIAEPIKGPEFREFRLLTPVRDLFVLAHEALISDPFIAFVLEIVEGLLGLDLKSGNLIETILNILEALLWNNWEPVPPYVPVPQP